MPTLATLAASIALIVLGSASAQDVHVNFHNPHKDNVIYTTKIEEKVITTTINIAYTLNKDIEKTGVTTLIPGALTITFNFAPAYFYLETSTTSIHVITTKITTKIPFTAISSSSPDAKATMLSSSKTQSTSIKATISTGLVSSTAARNTSPASSTKLSSSSSSARSSGLLASNTISTSLLAAFTSAACAKTLPSGQVVGHTYNVSIPSDGTSYASDGIAKRTYLIFVPPNYATLSSVPVIFSYHGGTKNALQQQALDQMTNPEFNKDKIIIYPQGIGAVWQGVPEITPRSDTDFTLAILSAVRDTYCVDDNRIYATGKSDGGGFVNVLACNSSTSKEFAAFAPVSGAYYSGKPTCDPSTLDYPCFPDRKQIPIIIFHGGTDTTILYNGSPTKGRKGECLPYIPHFVQDWAQRDGLPTTNVTSLLQSANPEDTFVYTFGSGSETGLVQHIFDPNIGHDWPSTAKNSDNSVTNHVLASFNATPIILDFFQKYSLPPR